MRIFSVENLTKTYGDKQLFQAIGFHIESRERIGLVGVNGTGKSTLLKVLAGIESADSGDIDHSKTFQLAYLAQEPQLTSGRTVLEEVFSGSSPILQTIRTYEEAISALEKEPDNVKIQNRLFTLQAKMDAEDAWDASTQAKTILTKLGVDYYTTSVDDLSGGQRKRVALAKALIQPADLLLLDEPTNHLDNETIEWLEGFLPSYPGAIMLVTHDRYFLNRITSHIFELEMGSLYRYEGNYETYLTKKAERKAQTLLDQEKHQNTLRRELAWLRRGAKARTTKQKARIQRVEEMKEAKFQTQDNDLTLQVGAARLGKKVLEAKDVTVKFGDKTLFSHFDFLFKPGDRIGIIGPNGSGKTSLLNTLAGRISPTAGEVETGETVKLGYYTQLQQDMDQQLRIIDYIKEVAEVIHTADGNVITAEQMLEQFLFPRSHQYTYIHRLSGGERKRLYLLRVLMEEPNVLFLDEPTNDLDTETLGILEDYLDSYPGVVITVSHDRYFLDRVVEQLILFQGAGVVSTFYGNYSEYRDKVQEQPKPQQQAKSEPVQERKEKKKQKLSYKEQQEWNTIEDDIAELEQRIEACAAGITEAGSDSELVQKLFAEQQELEQQLEQKMERWETLSLMVEEIESQKQ
ncbi:ABC-F family ATP-binding cassette domain-containing protein [Terribacillus sp. 179-K 1B1 HS]|uniref:ABC-F family ATP-binding cassette domain-containing protein n=1 Tax=Terribacillus sp. 179-K 1B1 HS TaxID=3142388 RepID=UPI0039A36672